MRKAMVRISALLLACAVAGSAHAGSTMYGSGYANWFYSCANNESMHVLIRHSDQTMTRFTMLHGQTARTFVRRGDLVATQCDARSVPLSNMFNYIVTAP
jgi:hypothetical protein